MVMVLGAFNKGMQPTEWKSTGLMDHALHTYTPVQWHLAHALR